MSLVVRIGEGLARRLDRRVALRRASAATFGVVAAWSVEGINPRSALADHCAYHEDEIQCGPAPDGLCNDHDKSYCNGGQCVPAAGCTIDETYHPPGGCWCNTVHKRGKGKRRRQVYWQCCDCHCPGNLTCTCK